MDLPGFVANPLLDQPPDLRAQIEKLVQPARVTASNIGLDMDDLLDERVKNLSTILTKEECYFIFYGFKKSE